MLLFNQIIERFESEEFASFAQNFKDRSVEDLEEIAVSLQCLYVYGDDADNYCELISPEDWIVFHNWEPSTQTEFLAYLAIKIAVLRN